MFQASSYSAGKRTIQWMFLNNVATRFSPGTGRSPALGQSGVQKSRGLAVLVGLAG